MAGKDDDVAARGNLPPHEADGPHGVRGAGETPGAPARATRGQRWLARPALAAVVVLLLSGGASPRSAGQATASRGRPRGTENTMIAFNFRGAYAPLSRAAGHGGRR
jgi:hypothetical protein